MKIACVLIGRNEGKRLIESLLSVQTLQLNIIYVDSGSSDDSFEAAKRLGVVSIGLDSHEAFSAARARNRGLEEVLRIWPTTELILFLDGDCTLEPNFTGPAAAKMLSDSTCAIVTGHLSERYPDRSIYNRLCSIEWQSPAGRVTALNALGGIMLARVSALQAVGNFNSRAIAGEEADLGTRLSAAGYSIYKIDAPMAVHDARIFTFRQWWIRAVRSGYAYAHRYAINMNHENPDGRREVLSALFWGLVVPVTTCILIYPTRGLGIVLLLGYVALAFRMFRSYRRRGLSLSDTLLSVRFGLYAKFAHVIGILRFVRRDREKPKIIEYK